MTSEEDFNAELQKHDSKQKIDRLDRKRFDHQCRSRCDAQRRKQFGATDERALIKNFSTSDTLQIIDGSIKSHFTAGDDYIVKVRGANNSGIVTLDGAAHTLIKVIDASGSLGAFGYDIANWTAGRELTGTSAIDLIFNAADYVTINAGAGNDLVDSGDTEYVKINGGAGADSIRIHQQSTVNGGKGNDTIIGSGYYSTFEGGKGNDLIGVAGGNNVYRFGATGGKDTIRNFTPSDQIQLTSGEIVGHSINGGDYVVQVSNGKSTGYVTLQGTAWTPIRIRDTLDAVSTINSFNVITNAAGGAIVTGSSNRDSICNNGSRVTIQSGAGNDAIFNISNYARIDAGEAMTLSRLMPDIICTGSERRTAMMS